MLHPKICCCICNGTKLRLTEIANMNMRVNSVSCCCERCSQSGKGSNVSANFNMPTCNFHDMPCHRCISLLSNVSNMDLIDCSPRHKDTMIWNETRSDNLETIWIHQNENSCHIKPLGDKYVRQSSPGMDLLH